jgi:DNA repair protein RadC
VRLPVSGNPARSLELTMSHDLISSFASFSSIDSSHSSVLLVRDVAGDYRQVDADELLQAAQEVLLGRVRGSEVLGSPKAVRDFLQLRLGTLAHEVFAVVHLDSQNRVIEYVEMFRGTVSQTSVYPREVVKDAMMRNSAALLLVHNHPSGSTQPSRADEMLTQTLKAALSLVPTPIVTRCGASACKQACSRQLRRRTPAWVCRVTQPHED